ncbi:hypothetical protein D5086_003491 [Populus alba]|uniref:Uncharacterized protein n=1 Tax=Populus alba TaxID=43335 RepID=A0ACC4D6S7_POPAL
MSSEKAQHLSIKSNAPFRKKRSNLEPKAQGLQEHWRRQKPKEKRRSRWRGTATMEAASKNKEKPAAT